MWAGLRGPARDFFQGLIQVSVGFYHLGGGNLPGARSMLGRALKRFEPYPERYFGFDLGAHRLLLAAWLDRIASNDPVEIGRHPPPRWEFELPMSPD
jgi:predicted metal-dependent hydrolase